MTDVRQRLQALWQGRNRLRAVVQLWKLESWRLQSWASRSRSAVAALQFPFKTSSRTAMAVVAVGALALLVMAIGIPVPFLAKSIAKRFETETGYRLLIAGSTRLRVLPSVVATIGDVSVVDVGGASPQTRFSAEGMRVRMSLWSLIAGRSKFADVAINRPKIRLPLVRERTVRASGADASPKSVSRTLPIIDRLVVEDGTVEFSSRADRVEASIENIELSGSLSGQDHALAMKASGRWGEQDLRIEVKGKLSSGSDGGLSIAPEFTLEAPGLLQGAVLGKADIRTNGSLLTINPLGGTVGQNKFSGLASVDFAGKPQVKLDLDLQRLDLVGIKRAVSANPGAPAGLDQPWSDETISLDGLNFFDAEMQLSAGELRIDRFRFAPISVGTILANGVLTAGIVRTGMYGGQAQGTLVIDASGAEPSHALRIDLSGVRALPLLSDVAGFSGLDGRMLARIDARGRGTSQRAVVSSLSGAVDLLVQDGELRSVNVARLIRTVAASTLSGWQENKAEKTDLSQLSAFFRIEKGQATTDNLRLLGPLVRVSGIGTADLGAKTLQFKVDPKLVLSLQGQGGAADPVGIGVPVAVQGPWGAPRIYPDMAGILDNPEAAYAKLRELGAGLFGSRPDQSGGPGDAPPQTIESLIDRAGGERKGNAFPATAPASAEKPPLPQPRPQPQAQARPQPAPPPPAPAAPAQSSSQSQSTSQGGPVEFLRGLFFR